MDPYKFFFYENITSPEPKPSDLASSRSSSMTSGSMLAASSSISISRPEPMRSNSTDSMPLTRRSSESTDRVETLMMQRKKKVKMRPLRFISITQSCLDAVPH